LTTAWAILSETVGIPNGLNPPPRFSMFTRFTGGGIADGNAFPLHDLGAAGLVNAYGIGHRLLQFGND